MLRIILIALLTILGLEINTPKENKKGKLIIEFKHFVGDKSFVLNQNYQNGLGENFEITRFDYYISNIVLTTKDGKEVRLFNSYHLIKGNDPKSQVLNLPNIPTAEYKSISFLIGIDKKRNQSGIQMGALDPANDMFWTWKTGYVFLKLEGKSDVSNLSGGKFNFHVGGFEDLENNIKEKKLSFGDNYLKVRDNTNTKVQVKVDLMKFFEGTENYSIAQNTVAMSPSQTIVLANNYSQSYSLLFFKNP